jgi:tetratricopeptide (TPR) repeat protein
MTRLELALAIVSGLFVLMLLWRARPLLPEAATLSPAMRREVAELRAKIEAAPAGVAKAAALVDAAEALSQRGRRASAEGYLLRALREDPTSADNVKRAATILQRWPRSLETVLTRRLAADAWSEANRAATLTALELLASLLESRPRRRVMGRVYAHAAAALAIRHPE